MATICCVWLIQLLGCGTRCDEEGCGIYEDKEIQQWQEEAGKLSAVEN